MINEDVKVFFELLNNDQYCILYNGNFIDAVTTKIINVTKVSLIQRGELVKVQNRFAYLIAESFQNIIRHGGHKEYNEENNPLPSFFMASIKGAIYTIETGNLIENTQIPSLTNLFETINSKTKDELKVLYKQVMADGKMSEKGGAGLGLIDMARKSSRNMEYEFQKHDDKSSMFYHHVVMDNTFDGNLSPQYESGIDFGIKLHREMINRGIIVLQKSDFSRDSVMPMLTILEKNIMTKVSDTGLVKDTYQVLIDLFQNISRRGLKYGQRNEGIFFIAKKGDSYIISTGNYINNTKVVGFKKFLQKVRSMSDVELRKFYLHTLLHSEDIDLHETKNKRSDVATLISERFKYSFHDVDAHSSFFTIYATI